MFIGNYMEYNELITSMHNIIHQVWGLESSLSIDLNKLKLSSIVNNTQIGRKLQKYQGLDYQAYYNKKQGHT